MGKKRKAPGRGATEPRGASDPNPADARLGPIRTFEDVADSEDEYFLNRDKIMLDDEPGSKRRKRDDDDMELSDEEVLGYEDTDSDEDVDDRRVKSAKAPESDAASDQAGSQEEEDESGWWGSSKQDYYNADHIETEADALEEEAEAKRLQQKKLSKMKEEDFVFDGDAWLTAEPEVEEEEVAVTEVLKDIEVTDDMGPKEMSALLEARYPEFGHLADELRELQPALADLRIKAQNNPGPTLEAVRYWLLGCYVAALASYLAILASPARDGAKAHTTLPPAELRDHDVMGTLLSCRQAWEKVKHLKRLGEAPLPQEMDEAILVDMADRQGQESKLLKKKAQKEADKAAAARQAKKAAKAKAIEAEIADLYSLPLGGSKTAQKAAKGTRQGDDDGSSDFGEEDALDARTAADKAARRKSLKFYTSQIVQKASRRAGAGRDAGGDVDIPHRERLRDRQARLIAQAEKRGSRNSKHGADLGGDSDDDDGKTADAVRQDGDEYYESVALSSKKKRDEKAARYAAFAAASKADRVVEKEEIDEDGKRKVTYAIEKNKGLTPKRSKDVRNPRVKRRKQYDAKQKKLRSMKPMWKGGEPKGGYRGESSGINTAVVKSIKL